jgi:hypothetical protein
VPAFVVACFFHLANSAIFQIGTFPYLALALYIFFFPPPAIARPQLIRSNEAGQFTWTKGQKRVAIGLAVFAALQIFLPLRHWLIPGDVNWTEEGHRMSWRMMLRAKSGVIRYRVVDTAGHGLWFINPVKYYNHDQSSDIATHPDMAWQAARTIRDDFASRGYDVQVFPEGAASLNGGPMRPLYDSTIDLALINWQWWGHREWVVLHDRY